MLDDLNGRKSSTGVVGVQTPWGEMLMRCGETEVVERAKSTRHTSLETCKPEGWVLSGHENHLILFAK